MKLSESCPGKTWQACFEQLRILESSNSAPVEATANAMMAATATAVTAATIDAAASNNHAAAVNYHHVVMDMDGVAKAVTI